MASVMAFFESLSIGTIMFIAFMAVPIISLLISVVSLGITNFVTFKRINGTNIKKYFWTNVCLITLLALGAGMFMVFSVGFGRLPTSAGIVMLFIWYLLCIIHAFHLKRKCSRVEPSLLEGIALDGSTPDNADSSQTDRNFLDNDDCAGNKKAADTFPEDVSENTGSQDESLQSQNKFEAILNRYATEIIYNFKRAKVLFFGLVLLAMAVSIILPLSFSGTCLCVNPMQMSTSWSRKLQGPSCPPGEICHVYINVAEDLYSKMIVKVHSNDIPSKAFVHYGTQSNDYEFQKAGTWIWLDNIVDEPRYVSTIHLTDLIPSTTYYFTAGIQTHDGKIIMGTEKKFKTMHNTTAPYSFVTGGDMELGHIANKLTSIMAKLEPDFVIVGGDIAYENGMPSCYRRWDDWFRNWEKFATTPKGYLVPMLTLIGNHEAGGFNMKREDAAFYLRFFSHSIYSTNEAEPQQNTAYHFHRIGPNSTIAVMDSGVITPFEEQGRWLTKTWSNPHNNENIMHRFVAYHAPIYPSVFSFDGREASEGRMHWEPIFNNFNATIAWEYHNHSYKRTLPIKNGKVVPPGTPGSVIYAGDGCWGVGAKTPAASHAEFMAHAAAQHHVFHAHVSASVVTLTAYNEYEEIFDLYHHSIIL